MSTTTTNYALVKPATSEAADITVINANMDTIDTTIKAVSDAATHSVASRHLTANQTINSNSSFQSLSDTEAWTERWALGSQCAINGSGVISFTTNGIYRLKVKLNFSFAGAITSGYAAIQLWTTSGGPIILVRVPLNTFGTNITTVVVDELIEVNSSGGDATTTDTITVYVAQENDAALGATLSSGATDSTIQVEHVRSV